MSYPDAWFSNAISHYGQGDLAAAEKSARRGLQVDTEHRVPKLEYLLAVVLMEKPDYDEAVRFFTHGLGFEVVEDTPLVSPAQRKHSCANSRKSLGDAAMARSAWRTGGSATGLSATGACVRAAAGDEG